MEYGSFLVADKLLASEIHALIFMPKMAFGKRKKSHDIFA